jgi:hypothetical protein
VLDRFEIPERKKKCELGNISFSQIHSSSLYNLPPSVIPSFIVIITLSSSWGYALILKSLPLHLPAHSKDLFLPYIEVRRCVLNNGTAPASTDIKVGGKMSHD